MSSILKNNCSSADWSDEEINVVDCEEPIPLLHSRHPLYRKSSRDAYDGEHKASHTLEPFNLQDDGPLDMSIKKRTPPSPVYESNPKSAVIINQDSLNVNVNIEKTSPFPYRGSQCSVQSYDTSSSPLLQVPPLAHASPLPPPYFLRDVVTDASSRPSVIASTLPTTYFSQVGPPPPYNVATTFTLDGSKLLLPTSSKNLVPLDSTESLSKISVSSKFDRNKSTENQSNGIRHVVHSGQIDPDIDEHFRRSLGTNYQKLLISSTLNETNAHIYNANAPINTSPTSSKPRKYDKSSHVSTKSRAQSPAKNNCINLSQQKDIESQSNFSNIQNFSSPNIPFCHSLSPSISKPLSLQIPKRFSEASKAVSNSAIDPFPEKILNDTAVSTNEHINLQVQALHSPVPNFTTSLKSPIYVEKTHNFTLSSPIATEKSNIFALRSPIPAQKSPICARSSFIPIRKSPICALRSPIPAQKSAFSTAKLSNSVLKSPTPNQKSHTPLKSLPLEEIPNQHALKQLEMEKPPVLDSVDDHFAKALGPTWAKLNAERETDSPMQLDN